MSTPRQYSRAGGLLATDTKIVREGVVAAESAPTTYNDGIKQRLAKVSEVQWVIIMPAGITSFDVAFYRYVRTLDRDGEEVYGAWVKDETTAGETESLVYYQYLAQQPVQCAITAMSGTPGDGFVILRTGVQKGT